MFQHGLFDETPRATTLHWYLMAFLAGSVNVGGFLACGRFVTHMTGFATLFGMNVGEARWDAAIGIISVPAFFLLGVMLCALLIDRPHRQGRRPHYTIVMFLMTVSLVTASLLGYFEYFGRFGEEVRLKRDYFFLALLCCASGLQNAAITSASKSTVRTTHLTGIMTDLGIGIVRALSVPSTPEGRRLAAQEWRWARFRLGTWNSFAFGAAAGSFFYIKYHYLGFLMPAAIAAYAMVVSAISRYRRLFVSARSRRSGRAPRAGNGRIEERTRA